MLTLYGRTNSINVQKVAWTLAELELPHERIDAGMAHGKVGEPWYRALNPNGQVPTIVDGDLVLWESNVIVRYLAARHAAGALMPADLPARFRAEMWMDWQQNVMMPGLGPVFLGLVRTPPEKRDPAAIDAGAKRVADAMRILDAALAGRRWLVGDDMTIADIPLACAVYRWFALPVAHGDAPHVRAWYERIAARPAFRAHVMLPLT